MDFETLFIIVIFLSMFFYYVMTQNCGNAGKETFSQIKNISVKNNIGIDELFNLMNSLI